MSEQDKPFYLSKNLGFSSATEGDELLHREANAPVEDDSATETQYFGFSVPEQRIHGIGYLWHHPRLKVVTGGIAAWRGIKPNLLYSELSDIRSYMNDGSIGGDLYDYRLDNGYGVKVVEPLRRHHLTYSDPARGNHVDLQYEALHAPVMFGDGNHFEQAMHVRGELVLRGQRCAVDCYNVRDRSWGKARHEINQALPPYTWMSGVFAPDFSFNAGVFDQACGNVELNPPFVLPDEHTLTGGWLHRGGKLGRLVHARKRSIRSPGTLLPSYIELEAIDEFDRPLHLRGTLRAVNTWQIFGNLNFVIGMMRWECDGFVTHGECQEGVWTDYVNAYSSFSSDARASSTDN